MRIRVGWLARAVGVVAFAALGAAMYGHVSADATPTPLGVTHVAPATIGRGGTRTVTVTGTSFKHGISVSVSGSGVTVSGTMLVNVDELKTTLTASSSAAVGPRALTVTVGTTSASLSNAFTVDADPMLTSVTPSHVAGLGHRQVLTVLGTGFEPGLVVSIAGNGVTVGHVTVESATDLNVPVTIATAASVGARTFTVTNPDKGTAHGAGLLTVDRLPSVTGVSAATLSQGETTVETVTGTNFQSGATVSFGAGVTATVLSLTATHITAATVVSESASYGPRTVTVRNPDLGSAAKKGIIHVAYGAVLTQWAVGDGAANWTTTLERPTFSSVPTFSFTGTGVTVSSESINADHEVVVGFTVAGDAATTWRDMTITQGSSSWFVPNGIKVRPAPIVTSITPLGQGVTDELVTVSGTNFEVCSSVEPTVSFSGTGITIDKVEASLGDLMYLKLSIAQSAAVGPRDVTITNCDSGGSATSDGVFTVEPAPVVTSIPAIAAGVSRYEDVTGTGFTTRTTLTLSGTGVGLSHVTYVSPTELTVDITADRSAATGTRDVTATNLDGSHTVSDGALSVDPAPTVASVSPPSIPEDGAELVTIAGTGFSTGATVTIGTGGSPDPDLTLGTVDVVSSTEIQVMVTADGSLSAGADDVTVLNLDGGTATDAGSFVTSEALDPPTVDSVSPSASSSGALTVSYTGSSNAPGGQTYTAEACEDEAMTDGCVSQSAFSSGDDLTGLTPGTTYYVTITADASSGYTAATSSPDGPTMATVQLATPAITAVAPSTTTAGQLTIAYTGSSNAPGGQTYTAEACTDSAMTMGCVTQDPYSSGDEFTGLAAGTDYYATISADVSSGYLGAVTDDVGPTLATVQLATPSTPALDYGSTAGSIAVTSTSSNAPVGETYTVEACEDAGMSTGCVTDSSFTTGDLTGLAYTSGAAGGTYYVEATANASDGYLASATSSQASHADTSALNAPGTPSVASSSTTAGAVTATFAASSGMSPSSYTAVACTNAGMTASCVTVPSYSSGAQLTGLTQGTSYYVEITAVGVTGYVSATSAVTGSATMATVQLAEPNVSSVAPSSTEGDALVITFTAPSNAPVGQSYTAKACTDEAMTDGCVTETSYTSGENLGGLVSGENYYSTLTALASSGYLTSTWESSGPTLATITLDAPGTPALAYGASAGSVNVTFSPSANAPGGQTYTVEACTDAGMSVGCVSNASFTSGSDLTGLAYSPGVAGATYYVEVTANASTGYEASTSSQSSHADTSQLAVAGTPTVASSTTTAGAVTATFGTPSGTTPASYTAEACTNSAMASGCVTQSSYTSGTQETGLVQGTSYYVQITDNPPTGYVSNISSVSSSAAPATTQLVAPTVSSVVTSSTTSGTLVVTFTGPSNAPGSQAYSAEACTNAPMTTGCVSQGSITSGGNLTGLTPGTSYYVTVTATASSGYLVATSSAFGPTPVAAADGTGTLTTSTTNVTNGSTGNTIVFTYTAATGGIAGGEVTVAVPTGWTAPVTTAAAGCTTASTGTVGVSGQTIQVTGVTLAAGATLTITYGATTGGSCTTGDGATLQSSSGTATFTTDEASVSGGTLVAIASSPTVNVYA